MSREKRLIIFEEPSLADEVARFHAANGGVIVAFSVLAKLALEKRGVACSYPDELIGLPDLDKIGRENVERVKKICGFLDRTFQKKFISLKENKLNLFYGSYYFTKVFFDAFYTAYFVLEKLLDENRADEVVVFKKQFNINNIIGDQKPLAAVIIEDIFLKRYSNIRVISRGRFDMPDLSISRLKDSIKRARDLFLGNKEEIRKYSCNVLVLNDIHDIPYLIDTVLRDINFHKFFFYRDFMIRRSLSSGCSEVKWITVGQYASPERQIKEIFKDLADNKSYREMFIGDDDVFHFVNECIEDYYLRAVSTLLSQGEYIMDLLVKLAPKAVVTSDCRLDMIDSFLLRIAKSLKIPVVTYQEGGGAGYLDWPFYNIDIDISDYFLSYGNGVKESPFITLKNKVIPVGSIRLQHIKERITDKAIAQAPIYVVLNTFNMDLYQHYPNNGGFFSNAYRHQVKILNLLKDFKDTRFVLKPLAKRAFLYKEFIDDGRIRLVTDPLDKVLDDAGAFIIDGAFTVLQECLLTDKPIALLYDTQCVNLGSDALKMLSKRVWVSSDYAEFHDVIGCLIEDVRSGNKMACDNEFLNKYCIIENASGNIKHFFNNLFNDPSYGKQQKRFEKEVYAGH